jgi:hypothetical protein
MTTLEIKKLKAKGISRDMIYQAAAGNFGLFGVAFFGHKLIDRKAHRIAKAKLNRVWNRILIAFPQSSN